MRPHNSLVMADGDEAPHIAKEEESAARRYSRGGADSSRRV